MLIFSIFLFISIQFTFLVNGWEFAVKFDPNTTIDYVLNIAQSEGFQLRKVSGIPDLYLFENNEGDENLSKIQKRHVFYQPATRPNERIFYSQKYKIYWAENQQPLKRVKRDFFLKPKPEILVRHKRLHDTVLTQQGSMHEIESEFLKRFQTPIILPDGQRFDPVGEGKMFQMFSQHRPSSNPNTNSSKTSSFSQMSMLEELLKQLNRLSPTFFSSIASSQSKLSKQKTVFNLENMPDKFNDELYNRQWYLMEGSTLNRAIPNPSMHVHDVWKMGYTGRGVVVTVIDDGLEWNHTDLLANYDPKASLDINGRDDDPTPSYVGDNAHGTRCGGEIAMEAQNGKCGVGIAFNARLGGIRLLDGPVVDAKEAEALSHEINHIDVFSSSWGPSDDGETVDGPKSLAEEALERGITMGRNGKGIIYVWASGNGGKKGDNCNCDGYVGSIYTLAIGSVGQRGRFPWYGERCSAQMAVTYSSNTNHEPKIATTDLKDRCTIDHTGTSAAAPIAAGIMALTLEANQNLTWRDVQHLVAWTSEFAAIKDNPGWRRNGAGLMYNDRFGFGLLNAKNLVEMATQWETVPPKSTCTQIPLSGQVPAQINAVGARVIFESNACRFTADEVNFVEHVQAQVKIEFPIRGDLEMFITSPSQSISVLLTARQNDDSPQGFRNWNFTTVHFWGEPAFGVWSLLVRDKHQTGREGIISFARLHIHGTAVAPHHMRVNPVRHYAEEALINQVIDRNLDLEVDPNFTDQLNQLRDASRPSPEIRQNMNNLGFINRPYFIHH